MFEVNGVYANRKGKYTVLAIHNNTMTVRYEDGTEAELRIPIQARIWENIEAEIEAKANRTRTLNRNPAIKNVQHFIKTISLPTGELVFPGWQERIVMAENPSEAEQIKAGDRLIYYALEAKAFFAVVTVTGNAVPGKPKDYFFTTDAEDVYFFPVDTDVAVSTLDNGVPHDSMDLESQPHFKNLTLKAESFLKINEDDFELLAELITEYTESDSDAADVDDDFIEDDLD